MNAVNSCPNASKVSSRGFSLPGYFKTDDMKEVAKSIGKSLRTVRRQVARAIEAGEILQVKHGEYKKM